MKRYRFEVRIKGTYPSNTKPTDEQIIQFLPTAIIIGNIEVVLIEEE